MRPFLAPILIVALALVWITQSITAQRPDIAVTSGPKVFESGPGRVALLELFTSQGCSSCPPADIWLTKTLNDDQLWKNYVPVAWHVDYWDRLGWPDPFASAAHTKRQYAYNNSGKVDSVYTPGFVLNGSEWRGFFQRRDLPDATDTTENHPENLKATVDGKNVSVEVTAPDQADSGTWDIHLAVLGFGLQTKVESGENARRTLINDFVALNHQQGNLDKLSAAFILPDLAESGAEHLALAVWLTPAGQLTPIQATGGWLN